MVISIVIILSVPIVIFAFTFFIFFNRSSNLRRASVTLRSPHKRGTNITTFGMHPRRAAAIHARHGPDEEGIDEHERVYQATVKAKETVPQYVSPGGWERTLSFLRLADPPWRYLTGLLLVVVSASLAIVFCVLFIAGYSEVVQVAIFMSLWFLLWLIFLDILWRTAQFGINLIEDTLPFTFLYFWAAVRATGDVRNGLKTAADVCGRDSHSLPLAGIFCEIIEKARQGEKIEDVLRSYVEPGIFPNIYFFFSSLNFFESGISASGRIADLQQYYRGRRKTRETASRAVRFIHKWSLSHMLRDIAGYLQYRGISWMMPLFSVYVALVILLLLGVQMTFSLGWVIVSAFFLLGLSFVKSMVIKSADQHERELAIILRPFHARLKQGAHPVIALKDVYGFLERGSILEQQFEAVISFSGGGKDLGKLISNVAQKSPSPVVERFWLAVAIAVVAKAEIAQLIDELAYDIYKN